MERRHFRALLGATGVGLRESAEGKEQPLERSIPKEKEQRSKLWEKGHSGYYAVPLPSDQAPSTLSAQDGVGMTSREKQSESCSFTKHSGTAVLC